jgi:hypothetical protein
MLAAGWRGIGANWLYPLAVAASAITAAIRILIGFFMGIVDAKQSL